MRSTSHASTSLLVCVLAVFALTAAAQQEGEPGLCPDNLLADGGFEGGRPNPDWTELYDPGFTSQIITNDPGLAHSGEWFANMGGSEEGDDLVLLQADVLIPAATAAAFEAYVQTHPGFTGLELKIDGIVADTLTPVEADPAHTGGYALWSVDVSAYADGMLHVRVPKPERVKPRQIEVKSE